MRFGSQLVVGKRLSIIRGCKERILHRFIVSSGRIHFLACFKELIFQAERSLGYSWLKQSPNKQEIVMDDAKRRKAEVLEERFLEYFSARTTNTSRLQETVKGLMDQGVKRQTQIDWAIREKPLIVVWISTFSNSNEENLWLF